MTRDERRGREPENGFQFQQRSCIFFLFWVGFLRSSSSSLGLSSHLINTGAKGVALSLRKGESTGKKGKKQTQLRITSTKNGKCNSILDFSMSYYNFPLFSLKSLSIEVKPKVVPSPIAYLCESGKYLKTEEELTNAVCFTELIKAWKLSARRERFRRWNSELLPRQPAPLFSWFLCLRFEMETWGSY